MSSLSDYRVLVCDQVSSTLTDILKKNGLQVTYEPEITPEELLEKVSSYEVIVVRSRTKITDKVIANTNDKCKVIARVGVGLDNIDTSAAESKGIKVINSPEAPMTAVAELVMGMMFSLARQIPRADRELRNGNWIKKELVGTELSGKYIGIVGLGHIGKRIARMARGINMNVIGYDIVPIDNQLIKDTGLIKADLDTLFSSADYITLHVPLTDKTKHMVNADMIGKMKKTACIINTSRGGTIDEDALYESLKAGKIGGAALDVYENEPATGHKLLELQNVVCTPHMGAQTKEAQELAANVIAEKIIVNLKE